ncbi:hypothetical protein HYS48_01275 [Candidatus Woesearchaeota archaeon]|nr:hypothetical protein [Candidatus Woesearchaeota archaeon]
MLLILLTACEQLVLQPETPLEKQQEAQEAVEERPATDGKPQTMREEQWPTSQEEKITQEQRAEEKTTPSQDRKAAVQHLLSSLEQQYDVEFKGLNIGEDIGEELKFLTETESEALEGGIVRTKAGITSYRQYLRFGKAGEDISSGRVEFTEDQFGRIGDILKFESGNIIFEHGVIFDNGLQSAIEDNALPGMENKVIKFMGKAYRIVKTRINTQAEEVELRLIGGGSLEAMQEGETRLLFAGFQAMRITPVLVTDREPGVVKFQVDNEITPGLAEGESYVLQNGIKMGVLEILQNEAQEGNDLVVFYLGANGITIKDRYDDSNFSTQVEINGEHMLDNLIQLRGLVQGDEFRLDSIKYRLRAGSRKGLLISPYSSLQEQQQTVPGFEITYGGVIRGQGSLIKFDTVGPSYELEFWNSHGRAIRVPLVNTEGNFRYGDDDDTLYYIEASSSTDYAVEENDYFILTTQNNYKGETFAVKYEGLETAGRKLFFEEVGGGNREITYTETGVAGQLGRAELLIGGISFAVYVGENGNLAIDLNGDGTVNGREVKIVTLGGGVLDLGSSQSPSSPLTITLTTDKNKMDEATSDETASIQITDSGSDVDIDVSDQDAIELLKARQGVWQGLTKYGAFFELTGSGSRSELVIDYPYMQRRVDVRIEVG